MIVEHDIDADERAAAAMAVSIAATRQSIADAFAGPRRIQRRRIAGWAKPAGTIYVGRPTMWGNPFTREAAIGSGFATEGTWRAFVVECFRDWLGPSQSGRDWWQGPQSDRARSAILDNIERLRGHDLACWCRPGAPCHADVLLEIANRPRCEEVTP